MNPTLSKPSACPAPWKRSRVLKTPRQIKKQKPVASLQELGVGVGGFCRASRQSVCGLDGRLACNTRSLHRIQHVSRGPGYASCPRPPTRHSIHPHALTRCVIPITTRRRARQRAAAWLGRWSSSTSSSGRAAHGVLSPLSLPLMDSPFLWNIASSHRGKCLCVCVCVWWNKRKRDCDCVCECVLVCAAIVCCWGKFGP